MADEAAAPPPEAPSLPEGISKDDIFGVVDAMLRTESWDDITLKVVMARVEAQLNAGAEGGWLKPFKKMVKEAVDQGMKAILANRETAAAAAASVPSPAKASEVKASEPKAKAEPKAKEPKAKEPKAKAPKGDAKAAKASGPPSKRQKIAREPDSDEEAEAEQPAARADEPKAEPEAEAEAEAEGEAEGEGGAERMDAEDEQPDAAAAEGEDSDESEDEDTPKLVGKPTHKAEGKLYHQKFQKGDEVYTIGQDVYLENGEEIPYVARLQEIFVYAFAPKEVYFNARWYYRVDDCHEYAREFHGLKGDVMWEERRLDADPQELFLSLHMDENHADCILRKCKVYLHADSSPPPAAQWSDLKRHEYLAWRA